jgi:DNA-binding response OmpR family regulator
MIKNRRLLIFDEDPIFINILSEQLKIHEEIHIVCAHSIEEALKQAKENIFDVILLNSSLSSSSVERLCKQLRRNEIFSPIIIITFSNKNVGNIIQQEQCANDYIFKPFRLDTLLTRLRFYFRQQEKEEDAEFIIGPYTFQPSNKVLLNNEDFNTIYLTDKETEILKYLYKATDYVTSRDVLLDKVWGYNEGVTTHTLETHIYRLRQKIEIETSNSKILITEIGGYRLVL